MILDFGCGEGQRWNLNDGEVIGIDINRGRLTKAKAGVAAVRCDGRLLPFRHAVFSSVVSVSVLEHIKDYRRAILEIVRVLEIGGTCRIRLPVDNDPLFLVARRVARSWQGDSIFSYFTSGHLLKEISVSLRVARVRYVSNSPITGVLAFFDRKPPRVLQKIDCFYGRICRTTHTFHWQVDIEAIKP